MISDHVKGKKKYDYPEGIQNGITLHRLIDRFTDDHAVTWDAKQFFRPVYRLYSGATVDIVYDHFLATDPTEFSLDELAIFSQKVYRTLEEYSAWLPDQFALLFPYMQKYDWLYNYHSIKGIERSLEGLVRRATYLTESQSAVDIFKQNYHSFHDLFHLFWTDLKTFARANLELLSPEDPAA